MRKKWIEDEIYGGNFWLVWNCDYKKGAKFFNTQYADHLKKTGEEKAEEEANGSDGSLHYTDDYSCRVLWLETNSNEDFVIDHEIIHLCILSFTYCNIEIDKNTEEPFAFYFQYLKRKIWKALNTKSSHNVKIKRNHELATNDR